jgi:hypothetical protein
MSSPVRVQRKRTKGYRLPPNTVSVCRPGRWGNPFPADVFGLETSLALFRTTAEGGWDPKNVAHLSDELCHQAYEAAFKWRRRVGGHPLEIMRQDLRGKNLACYCDLDKPCHSDILLELANQ